MSSSEHHDRHAVHPGPRPAEARANAAPSPSRAAAADLAVVGAAATLLDPEKILESLDAVLAQVRAATGAASSELFLLTADAAELVLVAHRGADPDAFAQYCRFEVGEGLPGLAVADGVPVISRDLAGDERFLRRAVPDRGYQSFMSVPVGASRRIVGTLDLAWKDDDDVDFERAARLAARVGGPIGCAILAAASMRERDWSLADVEIRERFTAATGADEVKLLRVGPDRASAARTDDPWELSIPDCAPLMDERMVVLGDDAATWPAGCKEGCGDAKARYCLPLRQGDELVGVARVSYAEAAPEPLTRHAAEALELAASCVTPTPRPLLGTTWTQDTRPVPVLELRCFGGFEVFVEGEPLPRSAFSRKKALELFQLLALRQGRPLPSERLTRLLWPGVDPDAGKNRLHGIVHALRRAIEPRKGGARQTCVVRSEDLYSLDAISGFRVDLWEFRRLVARARCAEKERAPATEVAALLQSAVDHYRGDLFADLPNATWAIDPRSRCREECVNALLRLCELRTEISGPEEQVALLRAAVGIDPLREDIHVRLIRALLDLSRRRDALTQYEALCRILDEELDARPSAAARQLRALISD